MSTLLRYGFIKWSILIVNVLKKVGAASCVLNLQDFHDPRRFFFVNTSCKTLTTANFLFILISNHALHTEYKWKMSNQMHFAF